MIGVEENISIFVAGNEVRLVTYRIGVLAMKFGWFVYFGLYAVVYADSLFRPEPHSTQIILVDGHDGKL